jgi:glycosyltransferase involved in cell wall biosynthesis
LRVLILTQYFWPESFRINDLASGLRDRSHEVTVLTGMPNYPGGRLFPGYGPFRPKEESFEGVRVLRVPLVPRGFQKSWQLIVNYVSFVITASLLGPWRCRGPFDVIFVYEPSPILIGIPAVVFRWIKKAPVLFWVQDLWPESLSATGVVRSSAVLGAVSALVRFIYRRCDRVLVQSEGFVSHVIDVGAAPARVSYFPNWAESVYQPVALEAGAPESRELPSGFRVMFAGNIGTAQSFETILEAARLLADVPDIQWVIVGDGHQRPWVEERVRALGLERTVHLLGPRPVSAMPRYFALADALLVTLRKEPIFELTVPTKLQSYLACGRPVIAALDGEGARIVDEAGAGVVCPAQDASALAAVTRRMYEMGAPERAAMGRRGRAYFEAHFDRETLLGQLEDTMRAAQGEWACAS